MGHGVAGWRCRVALPGAIRRPHPIQCIVSVCGPVATLSCVGTEHENAHLHIGHVCLAIERPSEYMSTHAHTHARKNASTISTCTYGWMLQTVHYTIRTRGRTSDSSHVFTASFVSLPSACSTSVLANHPPSGLKQNKHTHCPVGSSRLAEILVGTDTQCIQSII